MSAGLVDGLWALIANPAWLSAAALALGGGVSFLLSRWSQAGDREERRNAALDAKNDKLLERYRQEAETHWQRAEALQLRIFALHAERDEARRLAAITSCHIPDCPHFPRKAAQ
jgi:hypothetical protein